MNYALMLRILLFLFYLLFKGIFLRRLLRACLFARHAVVSLSVVCVE